MPAVAQPKDLKEPLAAGAPEEAADLQPRLHRRQFVLGPRPVLVDEFWRSVELPHSFHLSYSRTLPVELVRDLDGQAWHLVGLAFQSDPNRRSPVEEISKTSSADVPNLYTSWSGRWVLIGPDSLHGDACGLLACFHHRERGGAGALWVSSSPALLNHLVVHSTADDVAPPLKHACGMDWYPPPRSRFRAIAQLLPSQVLSLSPDAEPLSPRRLLSTIPGLGPDDALAFLESRLTTTLRNIALSHEAIWLGLTGGYDTRVLLAASRRAELDVTTFTYEKPFIDMRRADRNLPPRLAAAAGYEHRLISRGQFSSERARLFDAHGADHSVGVDRNYFAYGQWGAIPKPALILRGAIFPIGAVYYRKGHRFALPSAPPDRVNSVAAAWSFDHWHRNSFPHYDGIAEWVAWTERAPREALDWRDRFYGEQREAGWMGSIEQSLDVTGYETLHPANSQDFITALLSIPEELRAGKKHQARLVERMAPELASFPFNPRDPRFLRRLRAERNYWRRRGVGAYVKSRLGQPLGR